MSFHRLATTICSKSTASLPRDTQLRFYAKKAKMSRNHRLQVIRDKAVRRKLQFVPNQYRETKRGAVKDTLSRHVGGKGLSLQDVQEVPKGHEFDPNAFYDGVDQAIPDYKRLMLILKNGTMEQKRLLKKSDLYQLMSSARFRDIALRNVLKKDRAKKGYRRMLKLHKQLHVYSGENTAKPFVDKEGVWETLEEDIKFQNEETLRKPYRATGNLVFVTLIRSANHQQRVVKKSVHHLGLRKTHQTQVHADCPRIRGHLYTCRHLVHVNIVPVRTLFPKGVPPERVLPKDLHEKESVPIQERAKERAHKRRATKRDYSHVEKKYSRLAKESRSILNKIKEQDSSL